MRHLRLLDPHSLPRDGMPYTDPDTGFTVRGKSLELAFAAARLHRESNGLPIPADFNQQIESQWCRLNPGLCVSRDGSPMDTTCEHRGSDAIRWEGCESCGGVRAKVVACALFGECSEFRFDVGVKRCGLCLSRKSTLTEEEQ